jgi:hypothetical protein
MIMRIFFGFPEGVVVGCTIEALGLEMGIVGEFAMTEDCRKGYRKQPSQILYKVKFVGNR